jgi:hypothetical protein
MNGNIAKFRSSSKRREKTMTKTRSSKPDIPLVVSMDLNLHIKDCSSQIKQLEKEAYTRKRPMYADIIRPRMDSNNLMQSILYTTEVW